MDEPTAGQDYFGMQVLHNLIEGLNKEGKTVITITHDMEFVVNNFDRIVVMTNGKIIADGNKRDIFWDLEILKKAMLKQPNISDLAREINLNKNILSIEEFVESY